MLFFDSWDGASNFSGSTEQHKLEAYLGPTSVVFSSHQAAITAVFEVLGSRSTDIPVILPITIAPDTLSAVLRAGASPLLLDIEADTLQIDPTLLAEVLGELPTAMVVFNRPGGQPVTANLLELTKDIVTVVDTNLPPSIAVGEDCVGSFTVFDLSPIIGSGGVVHHKYSQQISELKMIRNGVLGLAANLNETLCTLAYTRLHEDPKLTTRKLKQAQAAMYYLEKLDDVSSVPFVASPEWPYFILKVENADKVIAHLHSYDILAAKPVFPLHLLPHISRRWTEKPEYPVAELMYKTLVALPTHRGVLGREFEIISKLQEV